MTYPTRSIIAGIALSAAMVSPAVLADTIKVAFIDPLSGPFAPVGQKSATKLSGGGGNCESRKMGNGPHL